MKSAVHRSSIARPAPAQRSAVSNGSKLLPDLDHRSAWARRLKDLIADHLSDLGGADAVSTAEMSLVRRASVLVVQLERMEAKFAEQDGAASPADLDNYQRAAGSLRRLLESLGLERRARDVTPLGRRSEATRRIVSEIAGRAHA